MRSQRSSDLGFQAATVASISGIRSSSGASSSKPGKLLSGSLATSSRRAEVAGACQVGKLGGSDEGAPGPRGDGFYAGYFRDPEGNKLNAFFFG